MSQDLTSPSLSLEATFPPGFFLENIVALPDDTLMISVANRKALYCLPPYSSENQERQAFLLETFPSDQWAFGLALAPQHPGLIYVLTTDFTSQGPKTHYLRLLDVNNVAAGDESSVLLKFPSEAKGLNGLTVLSEKVLLAADSFASCIWRIDLMFDEQSKRPVGGSVKEWFKDPLLAGELKLPDFQPGVNGLKFSKKLGVVCFSSTQQRVFGKIPVDLETLEVCGPIVVLHRGAQGDDLILDEEEGVAYLATHRDNSILRIGIEGEKGEKEVEGTAVAEGSAENPLLLGPTAGAWSCREGRKVAYFICDGGL